jgi:hypothetical protein
LVIKVNIEVPFSIQWLILFSLEWTIIFQKQIWRSSVICHLHHLVVQHFWSARIKIFMCYVTMWCFITVQWNSIIQDYAETIKIKNYSWSIFWGLLLKRAFRTIVTLFIDAMAIPVSSITTERTYSKMKLPRSEKSTL